MKSPARTVSFPDPFSLNWVIRLNSPTVAVHSRSQVSRVCSGTWLCTKMVQRSGSRPMARRLKAASSELRRSTWRVDLARERMQVDDAVEGVAVILERHPVPEGPEVVAEGEVARGGDAGEDPFHGSPW